MKIPDSLIDYIKSEAQRIHHGKVIIEINQTSDKVDVVTEHRERFTKKGEEKEMRRG